MGGTYRLARADTKVFTTGMVAKVCRVAPHTPVRWFDSGLLPGYRIPSGTRGDAGADRRVMRRDLVAFMKRHGMPTDLIPDGEYGGGRVLAVGLPSAANVALAQAKDEDGQLVQVCDAQTELEAGMVISDFPPDVVVVNAAVVDQSFAARLRAVPGCEDVQVLAVAGEFADEKMVRRWQAAGFSRVANSVHDVLQAVSSWRSTKQVAVVARNRELGKRKRA